MHLHRLTIAALGPFPGEHTIDFAQLGASGLFLLEGPTGAGKSTLIDAIVFALYGKVASKDASEDRLRSAHAAPGDETFVDLVLESASGIYRVRRTPAFQRPKQRGSGTTTQPAGVKLWRLTSPDAVDGELLSSRLDEAGAEIQRIVGLDRSQFVQTVVLPQGEFASFLRADPEARRGLLQKVFGTEVYEQIQERLERMRAETGRAIEDAKAGVDRAAARFAGAAGLAGAAGAAGAAGVAGAAAAADEADGAVLGLEQWEPGGDPAELLRLTASTTATIGGRAGAATAEADLTSTAALETQREVDRRRALASALARRAALHAELQVLEDRGDAHAADLVRQSAAHHARAALPPVLGVERAVVTEGAAREAVRRARASAPPDLQDLVDEHTGPEVQRKTLAVEQDACTGLRATLGRLAELESALPGRRSELAASVAAREARSLTLDAVRARQTARPGERVRLVEQLTASQAVAATLLAAQAAEEQARRRLDAHREAAQLTVQVTASEMAVVDLARLAQETVTEAARLQQQRIVGMAGELASALAPGDPCAVCGATEHPAPAPLAPGHVSTADLEAAEVVRSEASDALLRATSHLTGLRERLAQRLAVAGGADAATLTADLDAAASSVTAAVAAGRQVATQAQALETFDHESADLERELAEVSAMLAGDDARLTALRTAIASIEAEVSGARAGAASVQARVAALDQRIAQTVAWSEALRSLEDALVQLDARNDELSRALAEHGFTDAAAVHAAWLDPASVATLDAEVSAYEASLAGVRAGLGAPEVVALAELPLDAVADVDGALASHAAAADVARSAAERAATLTDRAASTAAALTEVERAVTEAAEAHLRAGPVTRMANLAAASGGDNTEHLTLATYVLGRRFDDVVAAANSRLVSLSDGRYELTASTEREDVRSRRRGLAMKVVDHVTETARDPRTLSGGETFYVSLCLALGLADVVTAEAGGIDLGTLFVDEGFGSLDAETLDNVLAALGRLRDGGRVVGVVSHVDALKSSIAERIEVRRRPDGASTLTVRA